MGIFLSLEASPAVCGFDVVQYRDAVRASLPVSLKEVLTEIEKQLGLV
jgi:hypothetical protein